MMLEKFNTLSKLYLLLILVVLAWGLSWPANKIGLEFIPPFWFATLRLVIATFIMFILVVALKKFILPTLQDLPLILSLGIFQIGLFILFINLGLSVQSASSSVILVYTTPLWVMPMAIFFFKEPHALLKWIGFLLGLIGILIMLNPQEIDWTNYDTLLATFFLLSASFSFAISILCARYMTWRRTPLELIPWQLLVGSVMLVVVALIKQPSPMMHWNTLSIVCVGYTAVIATALGFFGITILSKNLPPSLTAFGFLGVPVSGAIFSVILLHEKIDFYMFVAMIFIIAGLACVILGEKQSTR